MRSPLLLAGALGSFAFATGCVAPPDDRPDAEATSTRDSTATAVVVVERTTHDARPGELASPRDAVIARFVRVRQGAVDEQALRIAGAAWDLPALGTCSTVAQDQSPVALQPRSVDLLDVGVLTVDSRDTSRDTPQVALAANPSKSTILLPRAMPDPTGVVSGVFYSARSTDSAGVFTPAARLQLHTSGGPDMPEGFRVDVASPRDMTDVQVSGSNVGLDVAWAASSPIPGDRESSDVVYVDVTSRARLVARCTTLDLGHFLVPASAIASLGSADEGQLAVHRLHRESFKAKGIEPGEIRFDVARVVTFHR